MPAEIFRVVGRIVYEGVETLDRNLQRVDQGAQQTAQALDRMGQQAQTASRNVDRMGQQFERNMRNAAKNVTQAGNIMTAAFTAPTLAAGTAAFNMASQVENATGQLKANLGATGEEAERLSAIAQNLWQNNFGADVNEAALAVQEVSKNMLQVDPSEIENAAAAAFTLRDAFGLELTESTALADSLMMNFGLSADQAFDMLTTGYQNGLDYGQDFADTLREYGPIFSQFGMDANDTLSFMETAQAAGFRNLDVAADLFKEFSILASEGTEEFAAAVGQMGPETAKLYKGFQQGKVSGQELFYALTAGLDNIKDPTARFNAGVATMGTLFEDSTATAVTNMSYMRDELSITAGATQEAGEALYNTFTGNLTTAWRTAQTALEPFGNRLLTMANEWLPRITDGITKFADWLYMLPAPMQNFIALFAVLLAATGPVLTALGFMVTNIGRLAPLFTILTGPVGSIILLMTALAAALAFAYTHSETFRNAVNAAFGVLAGLVGGALTAAAGFIRTIWGQVVTWWNQNNQMILQAFQNVWRVLGPIVTFALSAVVGTIKFYWGVAKTIFQGAVNIILGIIQTFAALLTGNWKKAFDGIVRVLKGALQIIWGAFQLTIMGRIMGIARGFLSGLLGIFGRLATGLISRSKGMVTSVLNFFKNLASAAKGTFTNMVTNLINSASRLRSTVGRVIQMLGNQIANIFRGTLSTARSIFSTMFNVITAPIRNAVSTVLGLLNKIKGGFSKLKLKFPKITMPDLPHFKLKGKFSLNPPSVPKLGVEWYDKGGIFDSPSIIGVGEKRPEFVGALDDLREIVREETGTPARGPASLIVPLIVNGREFARAVVDDIDEALAANQTEADRAAGRVF